MSEDVKGLPVAGYKPTQSTANIDLVNELKVLEERLLRVIDRIKEGGVLYDQHWAAAGMTSIQKGVMCVARAVFQPTRITFDDDK